MKILQEFKDFAIKGNAIDMAVGIVIGAAFGKIVASLVSDVIMPPIGLVTGGVDFSAHKIVLKEALGDAAAVTLNWGLLANNVLNFIIVAFAIFMVVKGMNKLKRQQAAAPRAPAAPAADIQLLTEIRDLLKKK